MSHLNFNGLPRGLGDHGFNWLRQRLFTFFCLSCSAAFCLSSSSYKITRSKWLFTSSQVHLLTCIKKLTTASTSAYGSVKTTVLMIFIVSCETSYKSVSFFYYFGYLFHLFGTCKCLLFILGLQNSTSVLESPRITHTCYPYTWYTVHTYITSYRFLTREENRRTRRKTLVAWERTTFRTNSTHI